MLNKMIKVGTIVPEMHVGDVTYNVNQIIQTMEEQKDCGLLVYPELCITGYTCADLFGQSLLLDEAKNGLLEIAKKTKKISHTLVAVGFPFAYKNDLYNCAAILADGKVLGIVPKSYIPTYGEFYEDRWFTSGKNIKNETVIIDKEQIPFGTDLIFSDEVTGAKIALEICEDLWVPDKPSTHYALAGANIIGNLSASNEVIGKQEFRRDMVLQQSAGCYTAYLYVSSGTQESSTDLVFSGHSIIAENGHLLNDSIYACHNHVETAVIDLETIMHNRLHQNTFENETNNYRYISVEVRPFDDKKEINAETLAKALKKENYTIDRFPFVPSDDTKRAKRCADILKIQASGLATRVSSTGIKTLVIGISGGLDSTLALIVCHEAQKIIPDIRIIGYTMPREGNTSSLTYENALKLMHVLNVEVREVPIGQGVEDHLNAIGHGTEYKGEGDTTYENAQARMRTYILMDAANMENGLVVGTGDLSELALGWCTYNGDHMSMYGVNASVPKTLVQYICKAYADISNDVELKEVLYSIIDTPISPELTPSNNGEIAQKTEDKIGKYDLNDFFLFYVLRYGFEPEKIVAFALVAYDNLTKEEIKVSLTRFYKRFFTQQFKRSCLPDGPKVGSVTLSPRGDWRMPSDATSALWLEKIKKI